MSNPITKYRYISELEYNNLQASYKSLVRENQRLKTEVQQLDHMIMKLNDDVAVAANDANKYREMYMSLRKGKYLLIPK